MSKFANIQNGVVVSTNSNDKGDCKTPCPREVDAGWTYSPPDNWMPPSPPVPQTISPRQVRLWLRSQGKLNDVNNFIDSIPDPDVKTDALIDWEYADFVRRDYPIVTVIASALGMSSADMDQAFIEAGQL